MVRTKADKKKKNAHLWARDPDDWYVEPDWCNDGLFAVEKFDGVIVDPCCGMGRILDAAWRAGYPTLGFDIRDRSASARHHFVQGDFFTSSEEYENIACNPPYKYDDEFVAAAVRRARRKAAILLRAQWANAGTRSRWLESLPLRRVLALTPRPSMPPGAVIKAGINPSGGLQDYAWFIFERGYGGRPEFGWCRRQKAPKAQLGLAIEGSR
jgi:hypothetical protein